MSTEIQAQALLIMERIYLDIHLASLETQKASADHESKSLSTFLSGVAVKAILLSASAAMQPKETDRCSVQLHRLISLGQSLGWMLLSICSHSNNFLNAAASNNGNQLWRALYSLIRSNAISIELFAKSRQLNWHAALPPGLGSTYGGQLKVEQQDAYPYVISANTKAVYNPEYKTQKQRNIPSSFFSPSNFTPPPDLHRHPGDGDCAQCGNPEMCECLLRLTDEQHPLLELREYPRRGIGVRSLRSIKTGTFIGQYVGEIRKPPVPDSTYALNHRLRNRSIGIIDAAIFGNWTRYMNHSCRAGVTFVSAVVGQCAYVLVRAIRDIEMFEEITVDYGDSYFQPRDRVCRCGEEACRFKEGGSDMRDWRREKGMEDRDDLSGEEGPGLLLMYQSLSVMQRFL
ncbi:hypothetical protein ACJ72_05274 [Emergomyces africanus]|uniref:SET domain-containing protein n=1 Tax=Emergomyces africanus TaxID=1955775 RepID=A0A1B7NUD1_9EURO|nr:hypothetical protein ACJ72_05274 [Emergomyces africanus]